MNPISKMQALIYVKMQHGDTWETLAKKGITKEVYDAMQRENYQAVQDGMVLDPAEFDAYVQDYEALWNKA